MIKDNCCYVTITNRNRKKFKDKGYNSTDGEILKVDIDDLSKSSNYIITSICEICLIENEITIDKYNQNRDRGGFYSCKKCSGKKRKETVNKKYGVEFISQTFENRERMRERMSSDDFKSKSKETMYQKYGCLYTQTEEHISFLSNFNKTRINRLKENNEYVCPLQNEDNNILKQNGMYQKYGQTFSYHVAEIREKIEETNLLKYGHVSVLGNKDIQRQIKLKIVYKNQDQLHKFNNEDYSVFEFKKYRRKVRYYTDKIRDVFLENWNGYDYYDNEYIQDNFTLNRNDKKYPTIDHKISCFYGFINDIPYDIICNIDNLCMTKRCNNVKKGVKSI